MNPLNNPSHAESTWTANDKLWLRDFLPKRIASARIFIYGYNANVALGASTAGVRPQAECLLDQVAKKRQVCMLTLKWHFILTRVDLFASSDHLYSSQLGWDCGEASKSFLLTTARQVLLGANASRITLFY